MTSSKKSSIPQKEKEFSVRSERGFLRPCTYGGPWICERTSVSEQPKETANTSNSKHQKKIKRLRRQKVFEASMSKPESDVLASEKAKKICGEEKKKQAQAKKAVQSVTLQISPSTETKERKK